jgi:hypothetical protein
MADEQPKEPKKHEHEGWHEPHSHDRDAWEGEDHDNQHRWGALQQANVRRALELRQMYGVGVKAEYKMLMRLEALIDFIAPPDDPERVLYEFMYEQRHSLALEEIYAEEYEKQREAHGVKTVKSKLVLPPSADRRANGQGS